jgi:predicted alpha/beta hydrolase
MIGAMSREFVLVHGMSHGGWAWALLAARLERAGHRVIADAMMLHGAHDAVLVGHSMGGMVIPKVVERGLARSGAGAVHYPASLEWARWMSDLPPGERVDVHRFLALRMPCTYIRCLRDQAVTPTKILESV